MAKNWYCSWLYTKLVSKFILSKSIKNQKERDELAHWIGEALQKKDNDHFKEFYCDEFGFTIDYFLNKSLLDVGCGPSGSLEWAEGARQRIGIDPLANAYLWLGAWKQKMKYINCSSEKMPFPNETFDVVFTFNALDHVDNLERCISEIKRVLKFGGDFICITDCNHPATITEPTMIPLDFVEKYFSDWIICAKTFYKHTRLRTYDSLREERVEFDPVAEGYSGSCMIKLHAVKK